MWVINNELNIFNEERQTKENRYMLVYFTNKESYELENMNGGGYKYLMEKYKLKVQNLL